MTEQQFETLRRNLADNNRTQTIIAKNLERIANALDKFENSPITIEGAIWNALRNSNNK